MESIQGIAFRYFEWDHLPLYSGKADLVSRQMGDSDVQFLSRTQPRALKR